MVTAIDTQHIASPAQAIARARDIAGLDDFGPSGWQEGLDRSMEAFTRLPLLPHARAAAVGKIVSDLTTRLQVEQWIKDHPDVEEQPLEGPVFVIGLPRTGTTATVGMMALDDRFRFLRAWESNLIPPPVAETEESDPRLLAAREAAAGYGMPHMHLHDPDGPEEDLAMLAGLHMHSYHGVFPMPEDYIEWWSHHDFTSFYAYHERLLKLLQSRRPPHLWLLKSPPHLLRLREILRQYPDARFIVTHRDPVKIIGSVASLHTALHEERCKPGSIDRNQIGPRHLTLWSAAMDRFLAIRDEVGEGRFIDVKNEDVVKRPLETFERIYAHLGMPVSSELLAKLETYNSRNAPGKFGAHRYSPEEYGLTDKGIRSAFRDYTERFDL